MKYKIFFFILGVFFIPMVSHGATTSILTTVDNWLQENDPTGNNGTNTNLGINANSGSTSRYRPILNFSLTSIPASSTINSATLYLYYHTYGGSDPSGRTFSGYKVTRDDWSESQSTWLSYKTANSWSTAGGDFDTTKSSNGSTTYPAAYGWVTMNMTNLVQTAVNATSSFDILLKDDGGSVNSYALFWTSDYGGDTSLRPYMIVDYTASAASATSTLSDSRYTSSNTALIILLFMWLMMFCLSLYEFK